MTVHKKCYRTKRDIAPFSAVLIAVLMYWPILTKEKGLTYRRIKLDENDIDSYKNGITFVWNHFVSTTRQRSRTFPGNVEFITNNGNNGESILNSRRVRPYVWKHWLDEVIYWPVCLNLNVISCKYVRKQTQNLIYISLLWIHGGG